MSYGERKVDEGCEEEENREPEGPERAWMLWTNKRVNKGSGLNSKRMHRTESDATDAGMTEPVKEVRVVQRMACCMQRHKKRSLKSGCVVRKKCTRDLKRHVAIRRDDWKGVVRV